MTARPTINIVDDEAVAQSNDPTRNIALLIMKIAFIEKSLYIFANPNWNAQVHSRNAEEYHPTSATVWKWSVMFGTAVATIFASRPPRMRMTHIASILSQSLEPVGYTVAVSGADSMLRGSSVCAEVVGGCWSDCGCLCISRTGVIFVLWSAGASIMAVVVIVYHWFRYDSMFDFESTTRKGICVFLRVSCR